MDNELREQLKKVDVYDEDIDHWLDAIVTLVFIMWLVVVITIIFYPELFIEINGAL